MVTTETQWGPWIEWNGGKCPIPGVKAGNWQVRYRGGEELAPDESGSEKWWEHELDPADYDIVAYRLKAAPDDWKADMLAAWNAGELEVCAALGVLGWVPYSLIGQPAFGFPRECYRRRPAAEKPQEPKPADPNAAMIARDGAPTIPKYAEYAEPTASAPSAPAGLTACAPFTHKLGGWGL